MVLLGGFVTKDKTKKTIAKRMIPSNRTLGIFACVAVLSIFAINNGLFTSLSNLLTGKHTAQPLTASAPLKYSPAANPNQYKNPAPAPANNLLATLTEDKAKQETGQPTDRRHVKLLDEHRGENSKEYLNADGSKTLIYTADASSYKDANGKWQNIDSHLVESPAGIWHTKANSWIASFGPSDNYGVQIEKDGSVLKISPQNPNKVKPVVTNRSGTQYVKYENLWDGTDLIYSVHGSQIKESVIIHSKDVTPKFAFKYEGANISPVDGQPNKFALDGAFTGLQIAAPTVQTKTKGFVKKENVASQELAGDTITLSVDQQWFDSLDKKAFPIAIDPTIFNSPIGSSYHDWTDTTYNCGPGSGCGNGIGYDDTFTGYRWRFIYNVPIPTSAGQYLASAKLHVQQHAPDGIYYYGVTSSETINVDHASCTTGFNCVDTSPTSYGEASATIGSGADIEMASLYRAASNAGDTNPNFIVSGDESGADTYKLLDDTQTSVTFTYETLPTQSILASGSPVDGGTTATTQPLLKSLAVGDTGGPTDPDGPGPYQYRYIVGTSKNLPQSDPLHIKQGVYGVVADSGLLPQSQWIVPENVLQDGKTYYWQAVIWDSYTGAAQVFGPVYSFKVDLRYGKDDTQSFDTLGELDTNLATGNLTTSQNTQVLNSLAGNLGITLDYNSPQKSNYGLIGQYWNDPTGSKVFPTTTAPAYTKTDPNVAFDWGSGSPYPGVISSDNFLVRWTGYFVAPQTKTYQFGTTSDDRSRIFINGSSTAYVDGWSANPTNLYGTNVSLTAGQVIAITYEYAEGTGNASGQLLVKTTDGSIAPQAVPAGWLQTGIQPVATPHGLVGRYYTDDGSHNFPTDPVDPARLFLARTDTSLNQNWGANAAVPNGPADNFMVRWTGTFTAPANDTYTFGTASDDGSRVIVNGSTTIVNTWSDHSAANVNYASSGITMTKGQSMPITVEYYEHTGNAQVGLYVKRSSLPTAPDTIVNSDWLSPNSQTLPDGWNFGISDSTSINYDFATINQNSVTLYDSEGESHEYQFVNGGFVPPAGETGQMVRNGDGTITLQDVDGLTYVINTDGTIKSVTTPSDDLHPSAFQYTYGSSSGYPPHLTQITDGATSSRWLKVYYSGDASCPSAPSGFLSSAPANMACAVATSDGRVTKLFYKNDAGGVPRLARIEKPGSEINDYGYDTAGRIVQARDSVGSDAVIAGTRAQDGTELSAIAYDPLGRVSGITQPAATAGASRIAHTYEYLPATSNTTLMHVTGATETNGFSRKITYDGTYRTLTDTDVANLTTSTAWDPQKDLKLSTIEPSGQKTTYHYDYNYRKTDTYGPSPSTWFGADRKPLTTPTNYTPQVPHTQTAYDENITGLAAAYYNVSTATNGTGTTSKVLFGSPKLHTTGVGAATAGDVLKTWGGTPPFTPDTGKGWGLSLTGDVHFTASGTYTFRVYSDDGVRLWLDDNLIVDDWNDGAQRSHPTGSFTNVSVPSDSWHRIRLDYYNKAGDSDARLELYMTPPAGTETSSLGSLLTPLYGLNTTDKIFDSSSSVGDSATVNNYGTTPEYRLLQSSTQDPSGLNLATSNTYESPSLSGGFLRQLTHSLPGGATTNYVYYGGSDTRQNPCDVSKTYSQAGLEKTETTADPDGAGPKTGITTEFVYDNAGRTVARRIGTDPWRCMTYDDRDRMTQDAVPALTNTANVVRSARTINYNYAVGSNPLVSSISDSSGTLTTTVDLLNRKTSYADTQVVSGTPHTYTTGYNYDTLGRLSSKTGIGASEGYVYDNYNRISAVQYGGVNVATPSYDAYSRLQGVTFPSAGKLEEVIGRDTLGRQNSVIYKEGLSSVTQTNVDLVNLSQSNQAINGAELGNAKTYTYDKANRLTNATYGSNAFAYSYGTPTACTGAYNANAGKDGNRTSQTVTSNGFPTTTNYCYDNADRLVSSGDSNFSTVAYDAHGNISSGSFTNTLEYDSSDRAVYIGQFSDTKMFDPADRPVTENQTAGVYTVYGDSEATPIAGYDSSFNISRRLLYLPGGVILTINFPANSATSANNIYSLPNLHGDIFTSAQGNGNPSNTFYGFDPFGKPLQNPIGFVGNFPGNNDFGWLGKFGIMSNTFYWTSGNYMQMGSRMYIPTLGRFAQVDPVAGGNANAYAYPLDPVNDSDLTGNAQRGRQGGSGDRLSGEEQRLIDKYGTKGRGPSNSKEYKQWTSAKNKLKKQQKYEGSRKSREIKDQARPRNNRLPDGPVKGGGIFPDEDLPETRLRLPFEF